MRYAIAFAIAVAAIAVGSDALTSAIPAPTCDARVDTAIRWIRAAPQPEWGSLDRWCAAVGPPARVDPPVSPERFASPIAIVSWNDHVGGGDIDALVSDLRAGHLTGGRSISVFVILMQEAFRSGPAVPEHADPALRWASAELPPGPGGPRDDAITAARRLGLDMIYIPSMRNGAPGVTAEDRGNAILSTLPLTDVTHLWVLSEAGRSRQARALEQTIPRDGALVIGGDGGLAQRGATRRQSLRIRSLPARGRNRRREQAERVRPRERSALAVRRHARTWYHPAADVLIAAYVRDRRARTGDRAARRQRAAVRSGRRAARRDRAGDGADGRFHYTAFSR